MKTPSFFTSLPNPELWSNKRQSIQFWLQDYKKLKPSSSGFVIDYKSWNLSKSQLKKMRFPITLLLLAITLVACTPKPKPIEYGADGCEYCKMTIVDNQYAAEAVTDKGRVYKFDAIECMVNYTLNNPDIEMAFLLVNPFTQPGELVSADKSTFLISKNMPSPMGAFLSAYPSAELAEEMRKEKEGTLYNWKELKMHFQEKGEAYFITNHEK